jgi:thioredoxin reductase (NADPH)
VLITGMAQGGQLMTTTEVDNWPADVMGVQGPDLMQRFQQHAERFNTQMVFDHIKRSTCQQRPFTLTGDSGTYTCDSLIIATGASAKYLGLPSRRPSWAAASAAAPPATASSTAARRSAWSAAATPRSKRRCTCRNIASKVHLVHRRDKFRAEAIMIDKLHGQGGGRQDRAAPVPDPRRGAGRPSGVTGVRLKTHVDRHHRRL